MARLSESFPLGPEPPGPGKHCLFVVGFIPAPSQPVFYRFSNFPITLKDLWVELWRTEYLISKACALPEWVRTGVVFSCELQCEKLRQFTYPVHCRCRKTSLK